MDNNIVPISDIEAENIERQKKSHSLAQLLEDNPVVLEAPAHVELDVVKPKRQKVSPRDIIDLAVPTQSVEYENKVKQQLEEAKRMKEETATRKKRNRKKQLEEMDEEAAEILKSHKNKSESIFKIRAVKIIISIIIAILLFYLIRKIFQRTQYFSTNVFHENAVAEIHMEGGYDNVSFDAPPPLPPSIPSSPEDSVAKEFAKVEFDKAKFVKADEVREAPSAAPKTATLKSAASKAKASTALSKAKASTASVGRDHRGRFVKRK
jgi:hypothetical protein